MTERSKANPILGYSDTETVKLDFDNMSFKSVKYWASRIGRWFKLRGFIVLKSSNNRYHVVFDREVSWSLNVKIMGWACLQSKHKGLTGYFILQCIKQGSTLRISPKKDKLCPRPVYYYGKQDGQIRSFLEYRHMLREFVRKLKTSPKPQPHNKEGR